MEPKAYQKPDADLTPFGEVLYRMAINANKPGPCNVTELTIQLEVSIELEVIAGALFRAAWVLTGKQTSPEFSSLSLALQQRYRYLAERAIATIDPKVRLDCQEEAALATAEWTNGPYDPDNKPTPKNIADFAIGSYESLLSGVRVETERAL